MQSCLVKDRREVQGLLLRPQPVSVSMDLQILDDAHTEFLFKGPIRVYLSPYSAVVTGAFDLSTE
jgi:hypothetical protein